MPSRFHFLSMAAALSVITAVLFAAPARASTYSYTGTWLGSSYQLTHVTNVTVEGLPDAFVVGTITDFQTSDPSYSCLDGLAINVFLAPQEFPGEYVVHDGLQGSMCAYGTWTFSSKYSYTGNWNGASYSLTRVANVTVEGLPDAQLITNDSTGESVQITNFQTSDPSFDCLDGSSINVFMAQDEFPGQHVVHDGLQGSMCTYGTWLFMPVSSYTITIQAWIPQSDTWDPDTTVLCSESPTSLDDICPYVTYLAESLSGTAVPNCYTPFDPADTLVAGVFVGDNHSGYSGSYRTQTVISFDWNPASRTITNYTTNSMLHGPSEVTLQYSWLGIPLDTCTVGPDYSGLQQPPSSASSTSFTTGTSGYDPYVPGAVLLGTVINGTLWGTFNPQGTLTLSWETGAFPSYGVQVWPNSSYDGYQLQQVTNNVSGWNTTSYTGMVDIGWALNAWNALTYSSNFGNAVLDPSYPPVTGSTTLNPAP